MDLWIGIAIGTACVGSVIATFGLWRTKLLRIKPAVRDRSALFGAILSQTTLHSPYYGGSAREPGGRPPASLPEEPPEAPPEAPIGDSPASFELLGIFNATIPRWMGEPPISYAVAFLIVAIAVSVVISAVTVLLRVV